jgi:TonB family protein
MIVSHMRLALGLLPFAVLCPVLFPASSADTPGEAFDRSALVTQVKTLLPAQNTVPKMMNLLNKAIGSFERTRDDGLEYAEALEMQAMLLRASKSHSPRDWKQEVRSSVDLALQICELRAEPNSPELALALELQSNTVDRKTANLLWARAFQIRGNRVAAVQPETELKLKLPIVTGKSPGVTGPKIARKVEPDYPDLARHAALECSGAIIGTLIDTEGVPGQFHLLEGCGYGFDEKAVEAVRQWRFHPAIRNGEAVPVTVTVQVKFKLIPFR